MGLDGVSLVLLVQHFVQICCIANSGAIIFVPPLSQGLKRQSDYHHSERCAASHAFKVGTFFPS